MLNSGRNLKFNITSAVVERLHHIHIVLVIQESYLAKSISFQRACVDANFLLFCFWLDLRKQWPDEIFQTDLLATEVIHFIIDVADSLIIISVKQFTKSDGCVRATKKELLNHKSLSIKELVEVCLASEDFTKLVC